MLTGVSVMFALTITADEWLRLWLQHDPAVLAGVDSATVGLSVTIPFFSLGLLALRYRKHAADAAIAAQSRRSLYAWPLVDHIRNEDGGHDERQRRRSREAERDQHLEYDRREDQGGAVVGEHRGHQYAQQHHQRQQARAATAAMTSDVQRSPFAESRLVECQADQNDWDEGERRIPDDALV